jgi:hypothetical protein
MINLDTSRYTPDTVSGKYRRRERDHMQAALFWRGADRSGDLLLDLVAREACLCSPQLTKIIALLLLACWT